MSTVLLTLLAIVLTGCASVQTQDLKYYDISPKVVGCTVYSESRDPAGVNLKAVDRFIIDKDGNVQAIKQDSASGAGPVAGIAQSALSSGALTAVVSPIAGALFPVSSTTANVTVNR